MSAPQENTHPIQASDWHKAYPAPSDRSSKPLLQLTPTELQERTKGQTAGKDYVIVDVRRADCETVIPGAINLPAHSLPGTLPTLVNVLAPIPLVVFHCNQSNGRGPRAAGWYADALEATLPAAESVAERVAILKGGIKAWEAEFGQGSVQDRGKPTQGDTLTTRHL